MKNASCSAVVFNFITKKHKAPLKNLNLFKKSKSCNNPVWPKDGLLLIFIFSYSINLLKFFIPFFDLTFVVWKNFRTL